VLILKQELNTKHENCFKVTFSQADELLSSGFDYKLVLWNLKDNKKSVSRNILDILKEHLGEEALSYNPPFVYSQLFIPQNKSNGEQILLGLGNGMLARFKKKKLQLAELKQVH